MGYLFKKTIFERVTGRRQPQWMWDMALEFRIPALLMATVVAINSKLYYDSVSAYHKNSNWAITHGKLLGIEKLQYRYINVPRYAVKYEFDVDGTKYIATRATTGSPYRNWMEGWYKDTITEAQYLQSIPVLRMGERCTVYYRKRTPWKHSALAIDANSWEISTIAFFATFPILMGSIMKAHFVVRVKPWMPLPKMRIGFPKHDHPSPPPPRPPQPTQTSPIPHANR